MCDKSLLATRNAAAIAIAILTLCVLPYAVATTATDSGADVENLNIAAELQQFKSSALTRIDNLLLHKMPEKMQKQGEAIRAEFLQQLEHCAQLASSKEDIWRFKQCAAEELGNSMKSLGLLVNEAYNGASTKACLIWLNLLLLVPFLLK
ncbi:uncharacterized protein [Eurosta solidaginis]|uniref:uncharacterized protein n=1 Tax=Eurosta solidaginis TaxID=178769 RepID=UPI00353060FC